MTADAFGIDATGALPNLVVIGAMKCGTTAFHNYLNCHPEITMSQPKELNFFFGPADFSPRGNWHRGVAWYASHFDPCSAVRGESSTAYTSPSFPRVAQRMAAVIPAALLVYLVRDPIERAISQYRYHSFEGTERRILEEALLDPDSQYVKRGRYYERLMPFLSHFHPGRIAVIAQEELLIKRRSTLSSVFAFVGVDDSYWSSSLLHLWNMSKGTPPRPAKWLREALTEAFCDDADQLREFAGRAFPGWSV